VALWRDFPAQLAKQSGGQVFAYSRAGYGGSDAVSLPRPISYMHEEARHTLPAIIDQLAAERIVLLGHSDGASIALIYLAHNPDPRVEAAILLAPHVMCEQISVDSIRAATQQFETGDLRRRLQKYHGDNTDCAFRGWSGAWLDETFRQWDIRQLLARIDTPLLVLQGVDDEYGTAAQVQTIQTKVRSCELHLLTDCGHSPHQQQTQTTLQLINRFADQQR